MLKEKKRKFVEGDVSCHALLGHLTVWIRICSKSKEIQRQTPIHDLQHKNISNLVIEPYINGRRDLVSPIDQ